MPPGSRTASFSPERPPAAPGRARSDSAPPSVEGRTIAKVWLDKIAAAFNVVHPGDPQNRMGNCTRCAVITANALKNGTLPQVAPEGDILIWGTEVGEYPVGDLPRAWAGIQKETARGWVYVASHETDHAFVIVRHNDGRLYLVDSNIQAYKRLEHPDDGNVPRLGGPAMINILTPHGRGLTLYRWGTLHPHWR